MKDELLVRQAISGDTEAYGQLVDRWTAPVLALCHGRTGRSEVAEELAQETLLRGFEELTTLADPSRFGPWLFEIAEHTCRDLLHSKPPAQPTGQAPQTPTLVESTDRLISSVEMLPEELRVTLMLHACQRWSYREIALLLNESATTIESRVIQAYSTLLFPKHSDPARDPSWPAHE